MKFFSVELVFFDTMNVGEVFSAVVDTTILAKHQPPPLYASSESNFSPRTEKIDHFQYIQIQPETIDVCTRLWGITTEFVGLTLFHRTSCRGLLC